MEKRYQFWVCGKIDPRYDEALYGVYHAVVEGESHTLCGQRAVVRETKTTLWWLGDYGRTSRTAEGASCNRCRKAAGLAPIRESTVIL